MTKEITVYGKTVETALSAGAAQLGIPEDKLKYEVLEQPKKGFLGFGNTDAKLKITYEEDPEQSARFFLETFLKNMVFTDVEVTCKKSENGDINFTLNGENLGLIIGRHGEILDSLQYLTNLAANRQQENFVRITVDVENYREKREETLKALARKIAARVNKTGKSVSLEPMNSYERRIIHSEVQDIEGVITFSVGSGDERKIIVAPEQYQQKKDQRVAKPDKEESLQNSAVSDAPAETADQPAAADTKTQEVSVKVVPDISALGEIEEYSEKPHKFEKPRDFGRERSGNNDRRDGGRGNNNGRNSGRPNNNRGGGRDFNKRGPKPVSVNVTAQTQPPVEVSNAPVVPPFPKKIRRPVMNPNIKVTDDRTIKSDTEIAGGSPKVYEYNPQRPPREIKKAKSIDELNLADVEDTEEVILKK